MRNQIQKIKQLSEEELRLGILNDTASWHYEYRDQAYIYFGGLNQELTEGDILTIFSQYGVPIDLKLMRDRNLGNSRGFGYLKYEDQRSTILAVDNLNGVTICGCVIKVDHAFFIPDGDHEYAEAIKQELEKDIVQRVT